MANNCNNCVYHGKIAGHGVCCCYLLKTDQIRPCPPGDECTVKVKYRRRVYPTRTKKEVAADGKTDR